MSADNWAICPQCVKNLETEVSQLQQRVNQAYGTVDRDEYDRIVAELNRKEKDAITVPTLREDYEIGIDQDSVFDISYGASCTTCGYSFKYQYSADVPLKPPAV